MLRPYTKFWTLKTRPNLTGTNLTRACLQWTVFKEANLESTQGLDDSFSRGALIR